MYMSGGPRARPRIQLLQIHIPVDSSSLLLLVLRDDELRAERTVPSSSELFG
jgi:hypothetical protein